MTMGIFSGDREIGGFDAPTPPFLQFWDGDQEVGRLFVENRRLKFEGNADEAAKKFFDYLVKLGGEEMGEVKTFEESDRENKEIRLRKLEAVMILLGLDDLNRAYEVSLLVKKLLSIPDAIEGYRRKE